MGEQLRDLDPTQSWFPTALKYFISPEWAGYGPLPLYWQTNVRDAAQSVWRGEL